MLTSQIVTSCYEGQPKQNQLGISRELIFSINKKPHLEWQEFFVGETLPRFRGAGGFPVVCQAHLTVGGRLSELTRGYDEQRGPSWP